MLHNLLRGRDTISDTSLLDCDNIILSYPIDDEVLCSCTHTIETFEGGEITIPFCFLDSLYYYCCIICGGIVGINVDRWIVRPHVVAYDGTILLLGDDDGEVSICASFFEVVGLYTH